MRPRPTERPAGLFVLALMLSMVTAACSFFEGEASGDLSVFGPWRGDDAESFRAVLDRFEAETGIDVRYTGTSGFASAISDRTLEGDPPDVAIFPQPGLMEDLADRGFVLRLPDDLRSLVTQEYLPPIAEVARAGDGLNGVVVRVSVKSLVWYRPAVFAARGYAVPTTWAELGDLAGRMARDGYAPWCLGVAAGDASGWPATDWVEDIVLRFGEPETYDAWAAGDLPFTDPTIVDAFEEYGRMALESLGPIGGRSAAINTTVERAQDPMFGEEPRCLMYRQASFQVANLPDWAEVGPDEDVDVFVLPGLDASGPPPLLIGATFAAALTDREQTFELLRFLASPKSGERWAARGGFISAYADFDPDAYGRDFDARMAGILRSADTVRFDASDLMYPPVGTDSFLDAMLLYLATSQADSAAALAQSGYDR